jgi:hypothetical protein
MAEVKFRLTIVAILLLVGSAIAGTWGIAWIIVQHFVRA